MKLSEFKSFLSKISELHFLLPDGKPIPSHFHITEAGLVTKHFIDCGATIRKERTAVFQLWTAEDTWHRLTPKKFLVILEKSSQLFRDEDPDIEVEYQMDTIGKFGLEFNSGTFILTRKETECLANEKCGIPGTQKKSPSKHDALRGYISSGAARELNREALLRK
jgi:hypothetical protein